MSDKTRGGRRGLDQYLVFNVFIVVNEVLKDHRVSPMVVLVVKATVEPLTVDSWYLVTASWYLQAEKNPRSSRNRVCL